MRQYGKQGSPARNAPHFLLFCCFRGLDKLEYVPFSRFIHPSCRRPSFCKVPTTFRQFCKRNPDVSSEMPSPPQILLQAADRNFHNSFCLTTSQIRTTMDAFNHADAQRHLQDVSDVSFPASNPPVSLRHCAEPPSRRQGQNFPRVNGSEPRTPFWRTMCSLALPPGGHLSIHSMLCN